MLYIFFMMKNYTYYLFANKDETMFSSIIATNFQKAVKTTDVGTKHTYIISKRQVVHKHVKHNKSLSSTVVKVKMTPVELRLLLLFILLAGSATG